MQKDRHDVKQPAHLCKFNGRTHITARFLCARCSIPKESFDQALEAIEIDGGHGVLCSGVDKWIDAELFYDLSISPELSPCFSETRQQAILLMLGHYGDYSEKAA